MDGLLHAEFYLMSGFPNLNALVGCLSAFNAVHSASSLEFGALEKKKARKKAPFVNEWCLRGARNNIDYSMIASGLVVFQLPRVKSGKSCGMPSSLTDFSLSGATDDQ
jgi:hypothetical protein